MRLRIVRFFGPPLFVFALFAVSSRSFGADLMLLDKGRNVHLAMVGHGPLCDAKVHERSRDVLSVRLVKTTSDCGQKGEIVSISKEQALEIVPEERLTRGRIATNLLLGIGGVAALTTVPLRSSDSESWLILANGVVPGLIVYGAWEAVPRRRDYLILMTCPHSLHCFSDANRQSQQKSPQASRPYFAVP
jgi:hypothetical protein